MKVRVRLHDYEEISTVESTHPFISQLLPTHGPVHSITVEETEAALMQMRSGKAMGPDDIAVELWNSECCMADKVFELSGCGKDFALGMARKHDSDFGKAKAAPLTARITDRSTSCLTVFEHVRDSRIQDIATLSTNQCGFVARCGTTDAPHATRFLIEEHRKKLRRSTSLFLIWKRLCPAFDRVPPVPEELVEWVRILYTYPMCQVQAPATTLAGSLLSLASSRAQLFLSSSPFSSWTLSFEICRSSFLGSFCIRTMS
ncbi:hypothetical protein Y032_0384g392 [Ancylostoma ceylanicum]|uniref:Uncharacterized protein n=1 Tax=Ancylostoma ceylanicum TaxID=53326 RepID=A0A016RSN0_9BILA|nr:hypothetical protein Y032_0384g392 [Ancylostoma ceylanicum]